MRCQMCLELDPQPVRQIDGPYDGLSYTLYACQRCGSQLFDLHEHGLDSLDEFYAARAVASDAHPVARAFTPSTYWRHEVSLLSGLVRGEPRSVLDVGCRTGDFLMHWPATTHRAGVEIAKRYAEIAETRGIDVKTDALERAFFDRSFDVVTCYAILEHLPQPRIALGRLASLVAPGGCLAIMIPTFESWKQRLLSRIGRRWHQYEPPEHLSLFSRRFLDDHMAKLGFELADRRWTAGGMFNPFEGIRFLGNRFGMWMERVDRRSPTRRFPIFDHMYSYYVRS
jgi:SAM-dependent methyltransferase